MTLKHLHIFSEVCRMESITKAAGNLNMAQPAVSNAIRELETFYQVKLFERMNRRLYITDAGKCLLDYADSILTQFEESKEILQDIAAATRIRIGSNVSFGTSYLPGIISDFQKIHPEIPVYTMIQNSSRIEEGLLHNELDFAIVDNLNNSIGIKKTLLASEKMTAICSPDFPYFSAFLPDLAHGHSEYPQIRKAELNLRDFEKIPLLLRESGSGSRDILDKLFHQCGIQPNIILESTSTQILIEFCLRGQGVVFVPSSLATEYITSGRLLELHVKEINLTRHYYFVYHQKKYLTKSMKYFIDYILHNTSLSVTQKNSG